MTLQFIDTLGARERQLKRKQQHPELFGLSPDDIKQPLVDQARRQDAEETQQFLHNFRIVVDKAVNLKPNEDSDVVLKLKEELDQQYQLCCSLQGDLAEIKQALLKLIQVIMNAIMAGAGNDMEAIRKLQEENIAREEHFRLQEIPLIADLMRDEPSIQPDELAATLLTAEPEALQSTMALFEAEQLSLLISNMKQILTKLDNNGLDQYQNNVVIAEQHLNNMATTQHTN